MIPESKLSTPFWTKRDRRVIFPFTLYIIHNRIGANSHEHKDRSHFAQSARHRLAVLPLPALMPRHGSRNSPFRSAKPPFQMVACSRPNSALLFARVWTTSGFRRSLLFPIHTTWITPSFFKAYKTNSIMERWKNRVLTLT